MGVSTSVTTRSNGELPRDVPLSEIDMGTWDFWEQDDDFRDGAFATLRREKPISFWELPKQPDYDPGAGHWALVCYDDVHYVSRHPHIFSSAPSITFGDNVPELSEFFGSMIVMDDPRHQRLRNIVSRAFTPRVVARTESLDVLRRLVLLSALICLFPTYYAGGKNTVMMYFPLPFQAWRMIVHPVAG